MIIAFREISAIDGRFVKRFAIHQLPADRPDILPQRLVSSRHRILEQRVEARREVLEVVGIELEAEMLRLLDHPVQRLVRQSIGRVAAADIAVDPGKPGLLEVSGPARRACPQIGLEWLAPFVDGKGMIGVLDMGVQPDIMVLVLVLVEELTEKSGRAERPDGVPHANEPDRRTRTWDLDVVKRLDPFG